MGETVASLGAGDNSIELSVDPETAGVVRVTVLDPGVTPPRPIVERLVYRRSPRRLDMEIQADGGTMQGSPGDHVRLTIQARDENGQPVELTINRNRADRFSLQLDAPNNMA